MRPAAFALLLALVAGCDAPLIYPADGGGGGADAPSMSDVMTGGLGLGEACDVDPDACAPGLECGLMWFGGTRLACMRACTAHTECGEGRCIIEIGERKFCTIPCDPIDPFNGCPAGTLCTVGEGDGGVWATDCADWGVGVTRQNAPCGPSAGGDQCEAGHSCYTIDGGMNWRCTAVCESPSHRGCPPDFSCNPSGTAEGVTYGFCIPPMGIWPPPA